MRPVLRLRTKKPVAAGGALLKAADVSSHQPRDLTAIVNDHQLDAVIVRLYLAGYEAPSPDHSRAQIASARANSCMIGCYAWAYRGYDPVRTVNEAMDVAAAANLKPPCLWLDCETYNPTGHRVEEPGPDVAWLARAFDECSKLGLQPAIYSGLWFLRELTDLVVLDGAWLWLAQYDNIPTLDSVHLCNGLDRAMLIGHQYIDKPVDLNVILDKALVA